MSNYTLYSNGNVVNQHGHRVGIVLTERGVKGRQMHGGAAFYRLDQIKNGSVLKDGEAEKGLVIGHRSLDEVVAEALSRLT